MMSCDRPASSLFSLTSAQPTTKEKSECQEPGFLAFGATSGLRRSVNRSSISPTSAKAKNEYCDGRDQQDHTDAGDTGLVNGEPDGCGCDGGDDEDDTNTDRQSRVLVIGEPPD